MPRARSKGPDGGIDDKIAFAQRVTQHEFADTDLLVQALTHPSALTDRSAQARYERLEFLGDSVIGFIVAEEAFGRFPDMTEGGMTRIKISVVNGRVMSEVADEMGLADAIVVGESFIATGSRGLRSVLENTFEALTGALYLDAGLDATREWVLRTLGPLIDPACADVPENPKSALQEICQARGEAPTYEITGQAGPPHDRSFWAEVSINDEVIGTGEGRTKREAEARAAQAALESLEGE
jgi:ribonuclease-3